MITLHYITHAPILIMSTEVISLRAKKKFICENVNKLLIEDKKEIRILLVRAGKTKNIIYNKDGAAVNLDILEENLITSIYTLVDHKIRKANAGLIKNTQSQDNGKHSI